MDSSVGGLVRSITMNGISIDRFYHVILTSDRNWIGLIAELGLRDRIYFKETKAGFYYHGRTYSMATISEYLLFPLLSIGTLREILEAIAQGEVRRSLSDNPDDVHLVTRSAHGINTAQSFAARGDGSYQRQPATGC
jgi:protoporphyrinogen oxidase